MSGGLGRAHRHREDSARPRRRDQREESSWDDSAHAGCVRRAQCDSGFAAAKGAPMPTFDGRRRFNNCAGTGAKNNAGRALWKALQGRPHRDAAAGKKRINDLRPVAEFRRPFRSVNPALPQST